MVEHFKRDIQRLWKDTCAIYHLERKVDPITNISSPVWVAGTTIPCKLSFSSTNAAEDPDGAEAVSQSIKLFTADRIDAGSRVEVERGGVKMKFMCAGIPENYYSHYEIYVKPVKEWA